MLFNACMQVGYHPREWRDAKVVVIPIPAKPDYSQPKAHRPIALLECLGKLQEKVVTKRLLFEFTTHANKLKCCILLFDIKGFFDNVNQGRLNPLMDSLGFPRNICGRTCSFLDDRPFRLSFNGATSDPQTSP